jgi:hypothetical protein
MSNQEIIEQGTEMARTDNIHHLPIQHHASPLDLPAEQFKAGLQRRKDNRQALMTWIRDALVEGVDYGRIHSVGKSKCQYAARGMAEQCPDPKHWSKPSMFKPGAEKVTGMLGLTAHYPTLKDYEQTALSGVAIKHIILRCELRDASGRVVAEGVGARSLEQDYGDLNKALKMSEKSALIDSTLRAGGLSEVFTQDLEDMQIQDDEPPPARQPQRESRSPTAQRSATPSKPITAAQHKKLEALIAETGLDREAVRAWFIARLDGLDVHMNQVPEDLFKELVPDRLQAWAAIEGEIKRNDIKRAFVMEQAAKRYSVDHLADLNQAQVDELIGQIEKWGKAKRQAMAKQGE